MSHTKITKRAKFLDDFVVREPQHESQRHIFDPNELEVPCVIVDVEVAQSPSRRIGHMVYNCASDGLTTAGVGFNRGLGQNSAQFDASEPVFGACGAAALYRRRVLDEIGFLDEDFFLYDEDTDPISVVNWLVGSVSISLSRERRSNSKFA